MLLHWYIRRNFYLKSIILLKLSLIFLCRPLVSKRPSCQSWAILRGPFEGMLALLFSSVNKSLVSSQNLGVVSKKIGE